MLSIIVAVLEAAGECALFSKSEANWGEEVVRPLLDLGAKYHSSMGKVKADNV